MACKGCGAPDDQGCYVGCGDKGLFKGQGITARTKDGQFTLRSDIYAPITGPTFSFLGDNPDGFIVKDSGKREEYASGMRRDTQEGKPMFTLLPRKFLHRWAMHMAKGAEKYGRENWTLANSQEELDRFKDSAFRHFIQWLDGDRTEDHAVAIAFNVSAAEHLEEKLKGDG